MAREGQARQESKLPFLFLFQCVLPRSVCSPAFLSGFSSETVTTSEQEPACYSSVWERAQETFSFVLKADHHLVSFPLGEETSAWPKPASFRCSGDHQRRSLTPTSTVTNFKMALGNIFLCSGQNVEKFAKSLYALSSSELGKRKRIE